jgi:hypothetical protein
MDEVVLKVLGVVVVEAVVKVVLEVLVVIVVVEVKIVLKGSSRRSRRWIGSQR